MLIFEGAEAGATPADAVASELMKGGQGLKKNKKNMSNPHLLWWCVRKEQIWHMHGMNTKALLPEKWVRQTTKNGGGVVVVVFDSNEPIN